MVVGDVPERVIERPFTNISELCFNNRVPRPRSITDERLFAAAGAVLGRDGPSFTLADVATQAGVAVGTVAKRFGSRSGLLQALSRQSTTDTRWRIREAARAAGSPVEALRAALFAWAGPMGEKDTAANNVAALGEDLLDPKLRELLGEHYAMVTAEVRELVAAAAADLPRAPKPAQAARLLVALLNGSAIDWSIRPAGRLRSRIRQDVDNVLAGWVLDGWVLEGRT